MKTTYLVMLLILATIAGVSGFAIYSVNQPGQYDEFAACLGEEGAVFYGAFWCQFCNEQKAMFGRSARNLPYVECSNNDRSMNDVCVEEEISSYPTWKFANGNVLTGAQTLETLAAETGCSIDGSPVSEISVEEEQETSELATEEENNLPE